MIWFVLIKLPMNNKVHRHVQGSQACAKCRPIACRANFRALTLIVSISGLAAFNALYVPLKLEQAVHSHPRSTALLAAARAPDWPANLNSTSAGKQPQASAVHLTSTPSAPLPTLSPCPPLPSGTAAYAAAVKPLGP